KTLLPPRTAMRGGTVSSLLADGCGAPVGWPLRDWPVSLDRHRPGDSVQSPGLVLRLYERPYPADDQPPGYDPSGPPSDVHQKVQKAVVRRNVAPREHMGTAGRLDDAAENEDTN